MDLNTKHNTITQILEDFGNEIRQDLRDELRKNDSYVSGDLAEQINFEAKIMGTKFVFQLSLKDYYDYVNKGVSGTEKKRPNTPYSYISSSKIPFKFAYDWMNNKNLFATPGTTFTSLATRQKYKAGSKNSQAFAMARSFKERGTKGNHFYDNVVTEKRLQKLREDLGRAAVMDIQTVITEAFKLED